MHQRFISLNGKKAEDQRREVFEQANVWTEAQAARLGVSPSEILAAVVRGWTPSDVERLPLSHAGALEAPPGLEI